MYSVRVLGSMLTGKGAVFAGGLKWALDNGMHVINLSLSTKKRDFYAMFHELTDEAYFKNVMLVSAINNVPAPSYPSQYSSVFSVAAHEGKDPMHWDYNPSPPGRVRRAGHRRRGAVAERLDDPLDRQQLRRAVHRRHRHSDPQQAPRPHSVPDENDPPRRRRQLPVANGFFRRIRRL